VNNYYISFPEATTIREEFNRKIAEQLADLGILNKLSTLIRNAVDNFSNVAEYLCSTDVIDWVTMFLEDKGYDVKRVGYTLETIDRKDYYTLQISW